MSLTCKMCARALYNNKEFSSKILNQYTNQYRTQQMPCGRQYTCLTSGLASGLAAVRPASLQAVKCAYRTPWIPHSRESTWANITRRLHGDIQGHPKSSRFQDKENWYCDITDVVWAKRAAEILGDQWTAGEEPLHECYPGQGLVTEALLNVRSDLKVAAWEPRRRYGDQLQKLSERYSQRLTVLDQCLLKPSQALHRYQLMGWQAHRQPAGQDSALADPHCWKDEPQLQICGLLPQSRLRSFLMYSSLAMAHQAFPFHKGRPQFFFFLREKIQQILQSAPRINQHGRFPAAVLFMYLLYDVETLLQIPGHATNKPDPCSSKDKEYGSLYLTKLTPKTDLFERVCAQDLWEKCIFFVNHVSWQQYSRLIPWIEQLAPGHGLQMLRDGYSMADKVGCINADHIPKLFKELVDNHGLLESKLLSEVGTKKYIYHPPGETDDMKLASERTRTKLSERNAS